MSQTGSKRRLPTRLIKTVLPVIVLAVSVVIAFIVLESRPTAPRAPARARQARLVTVTPAEAAPPTLSLNANGTVKAADSTTLRARVSGQIETLADKLAPGTRFGKGDVLATIDAADYRLALTRAKSDLASAQASLRVERGQQAVAQRELSLVGTKVSAEERDLALRGPQLQQAKADVDSAKTAVEQARLDLDRTRVKAPFNGIVTDRSASIGDVIATSDTLATLAATDVYWVDVSIPVDQLRWLHASSPDRPGSHAAIHYPEAWGDDTTMGAEVLRIQPALEADGRMARVLLRVPRPLGGGAPDGPQLLIGAYVTAGITADIPPNSVVIDAAFLHENNHVWVMSHDNTLDIRSVDVVYRDATQAVIAGGLAAGDSVVTSELTAPIQDMPLRVESGLSSSGKPTTDTSMQTASADSAPHGPALNLRLTPHPDDERENAGRGEPRS